MNNEFTLTQQAGLVIADLIRKNQDFSDVQSALSEVAIAESDALAAKARLDRASKSLHALILKHRGVESNVGMVQVKELIDCGC